MNEVCIETVPTCTRGGNTTKLKHYPTDLQNGSFALAVVTAGLLHFIQFLPLLHEEHVHTFRIKYARAMYHYLNEALALAGAPNPSPSSALHIAEVGTNKE